MAREVLTIYDSDEEGVEVLRSLGPRPVFRPREKASRAVNSGPVVDLTGDDDQDDASTARPDRRRARSPPSINLLARTRTSPRPGSPAVAKAASLDGSSSDDEDELPDDPTPKASFARPSLLSDTRQGSKVASSSSSLRNTSRPSSPKKRPRDEDDNTQPKQQPEKRRRVVSHNETRDATHSPTSWPNLVHGSPRADDKPRPTTTPNNFQSGAGATDEPHVGIVANATGLKEPTSLKSKAVSHDSINTLGTRQAKFAEPHSEPLGSKANDSNRDAGSYSDPVGPRRNAQTGLPNPVLARPCDLLNKSSPTVDNDCHNSSKTSTPASKKRRKEKTPVSGSRPADSDGRQTSGTSKMHKPTSPSRHSPPTDKTSTGASPSDQLHKEAGEDLSGPDSEVHTSPVIALTSDDQVLEPELEGFQAQAVTDEPLEPAMSVFPVERQVERILGKYYQEMREDTDYYTKAWLKRSRRSKELLVAGGAMVSSDNARSDQPSVASAVFARLRTGAVTRPTTATAKLSNDHLKFNVDVFNGANKPTRCYIKAKSCSLDVTQSANDVPEYAHYVSLKTNILAPNTTTMTVWPYFGDGVPDPEEFENYYHMDTDKRHRKIRRLLESQKVEEYVESALQDLHITWDDVLRFLLDPRPDVGMNAVAQSAMRNRDAHQEDFPKVADSKKWMMVLSSLSDTTQERLKTAAILCDNFQRMAKFPLWHVARRSATVERVLQPEDTTISSVESRICRVCLQFDCHQHGELKESCSDTDTESGAETDDAEAKDILYPLRVNFRKRVPLPQSLPERSTSEEEGATTRSVSAIKGMKAPKHWENSKYTAPGEWPPFYPCNHPGQTCASAECSCFVNKRPCEKICMCAADCSRKFQGCSCSLSKHRKSGDYLCWRDDRCACYKIGRECDPDLCGACGVCEVLDPVHRHNPDAIDVLKTCHNASMQKGVPKHTLLGDSGIHGMGLYAGQHIKPHEFVGEYKGEIITKEEADRRGAVYEKQKSTYLFSLNTEQEVDSNFYGNKIRFINHRNKSGANVYPLIVTVNTVHRIGLFAQREIKSGEELFFDYGPKFPEHLLGGAEASSSKSAPHVRNANMVLNDFYDVEDDEDEAGNRRARKAPANGNLRGRPRKPEPAAKPLKIKKPMGGARPGAGRKPGKQKEDSRPAAATGRKTAKRAPPEDARITSQSHFEAFYISEGKDQSRNDNDEDDDDFVDGGASEQESSEEDEESDDDRVRLGVSRYGRARGRPAKMDL
jgi:hypothetical protein